MGALKATVKKILIKLGIVEKKEPLSKEQKWAARGVVFGENFHGPDSAIDYCFGHLVTIGDNVTISGTTILAHDGSTKKILGYSKVAPVTIGSDVFIGYGSIVLPGVTIGNKVIVGAGTVVSKDIPDNSVVVRGTTDTYRFLSTYDEYVEKQRKMLESKPKSDIHFSKRTEKEWEEWKQELNRAGSGFDL